MDEQGIERAWKCKNGHVMGQLKRVHAPKKWNARHHETRLILYRHAIDVDAENPAEVEVLTTLTAFGDAPNIKCDVCGATRPWNINKDLLDKLIANTRKGR